MALLARLALRRRTAAARGLYCRSSTLMSSLRQQAPTVGPPPAFSPSMASSVVSRSPAFSRPYLRLMRVDRPIGTWLLFWPCGWSIALAAGPGCAPDLGALALFAAGAMVMRGAGCTINDLWDRDIDRRVERTRDRPLASGEIQPMDALALLAGQMGAGLAVLSQLNAYCVALGASSLGLVVLYPLAKRMTHWPQLVLGLTFNWGALLGWAAVRGGCEWAVCFPLYLACVSWTMVYDTIYAHQDAVDDRRIGLKSTAIRFGEDSRVWLSGFSAVMVGGLCLAGVAASQTWPFYLSVAAAAAHLGHQVGTLDIRNGPDCGKKFVSNRRLGAIVFTGIVLGTLLKTEENGCSDKRAEQGSKAASPLAVARPSSSTKPAVPT